MSLMYKDRIKNIPVQRCCPYSCTYCYAVNSTWVRTAKCELCKSFTPHAHLESLKKRPPKTSGDEFCTIALGGDISFAEDSTMQAIIRYCQQYKDTNFLLQSKNPEFFLQYRFPENVILGTTIESNKDTWFSSHNSILLKSVIRYSDISKAPPPAHRVEAMRELRVRCPNKRTVTIEPLMQFEKEVLVDWMKAIAPWKVWIGYNNHLNYAYLEEPSLAETEALIKELETFTTVCRKTIRERIIT